jgi:cell wall-associated NlpC family hydrolase
VGRRLLAVAVLPALALAGTAVASSSKSAASWATPEIRAVTAAGLMGSKDVASFHANDVLTAQALENLAFDLQQRFAPPEPEPPVPPEPVVTDPTQPTVPPPSGPPQPGATPPPVQAAAPVAAAPKQLARPDAPVTMAQLDARLVSALGLRGAAGEFAAGARAAGLKIPSRFGTEVVARLLGLRFNHPASEDALELLPNDPATRAEAAYSAAQVLHFDDWEASSVQSLADAFALPELTDWQKSILTTAVGRIGMPYIWGGETDGPQTAFGVTSRGGYDCSGFVWRIYKLQSYADEGDLASILQGRTTYDMSGEVPRSQRVGFADLQPADVIFFGDRGPRSQPSQVGHMGIYIGNGWFIHSSRYGVALATLDGWYKREFAWARRPLAEAGLTS